MVFDELFGQFETADSKLIKKRPEALLLGSFAPRQTRTRQLLSRFPLVRAEGELG